MIMDTVQCKVRMNDALSASLVQYRADGTEPLYSVSALLFMVLHERQNGGTATIAEKIFEHIENLLGGGNEPVFDAFRYHSYPVLAAAIAVMKQTPSIWDGLSDIEKEKLDCIMRAFAYITNFISNDANTYCTGIALKGGTNKKWNPNYRLSLIAPMIFCISYFGGVGKVNDILLGFDYDTEVGNFERYGFTNAIGVWTTDGFNLADGTRALGAKELLMNGGDAYVKNGENVYSGGTGVGVKVAYIYNETDDVVEVARQLLQHCYGGGKVTSRTDENADGIYDAYIMDGTDSPLEGQEGMMKEFNAADRNGARSHAGYCLKDFCMAVAIMATCAELGIYDVRADADLYAKICVGNEDLMYKLKHGYRSYALGRGCDIKESDMFGYPLWKAYWYSHFASNETVTK